jgi:carbamoyl-phosphate synthase small subunit
MSQRTRCTLVLEDGTCFKGWSCGARGEAFGELCFNTSMVGYQEVVSDPSYAGQIVTMTYPQIGNYGCNEADMQADHLALRGLVVHEMCTHPSNFRSTESLPDLLKREGVVAIDGVDTRAIVRHVRDHGAMRAVLSTETSDADELLRKVRESPSIVGTNLASTVSCQKAYRFEPSDYARPILSGSAAASAEARRAPRRTHEVVAYDCGIKRAILYGLVNAGCNVTVVPWDTTAEEVMSHHPDGVFVSNGPGDPEPVVQTATEIRKLFGRVPIFGICLGNQLIAQAAGGSTYKLKFGHHGGNQPVMNLLTGSVEITSQNHGFNVDVSSLGTFEGAYALDDPRDLRSWARRHVAPICTNPDFGRIQVTHVNLNDGTAEGLSFLDIPLFSVQYHPEASPGPEDAAYLFQAFSRLMDGREDYLDIDLRPDRLGIRTARERG